MTNFEQLAEQHIREHESHLKHIDELLDRAHKGVGEGDEWSEVIAQLTEMARQREKLASRIADLKQKAPADWQEKEIEQAGPMGIWDAVAQQLEKLVERIER